MKALKIVGILLLLVLIAAGGAIYYVVSNLDRIVEQTVERTGTRMTGTGVSLDSVSLQLTSGSGTLRGLTIANPPGYESDYAFSIDEVAVGIRPASLAGPVIVISEVRVVGARLNAEQRGEGSNLTDILANVKQASGDAPAEPEPAAAPEGEPPRLALESFVFADTEGRLLTDFAEPVALRVPDVERAGIGDPAVGLTPAELSSQLLRAVLEEVQAAVTRQLARMAAERAKDEIGKKLEEKGGDLGKSLKGLIDRG